MKSTFFMWILTSTLTITLNAQSMRMVMGVGGGSKHTVGQTFVGFGSGTPNKLWQGFWMPKTVITSVSESNPFDNKNQRISKVYPNPATTTVNFKSPETILNIEIYSISGETIYTGQNLSVSLYGVSAGTYIVKIIHQNGTVDFHKLFVTR